VSRQLILICFGTLGDVKPFIEIGKLLHRRGNRVLIATNANFETAVRAAGLNYNCIWRHGEIDKAFSHPHFWHPVIGPQLAWDLMGEPVMRRTYAFLKQHSSGDSLVIATWAAFGARIFCEHFGIPLCTIYLSPAALEACNFDGSRGDNRNARQLDRLFAPKLNQFRRELRLPPVDRICDKWMHSSEIGLALFPEWFCSRQPYWPPSVRTMDFIFLEDDAYVCPTSLMPFLREGPPVVVFVGGSGVRCVETFFRESISLTKRLGTHALLLTHFPQALPQTHSDSVLHLDYVPLELLQGQVAAVVHHAGIGTCARAAQLGVPQLCVPRAFDQFDNARRIADLGIGATLNERDYSADAAASALSRLFTNAAMSARCRATSELCAGSRWTSLLEPLLSSALSDSHSRVLAPKWTADR
jgi:UDP:flavonoid glycosyltransferase YjiC (YdhE family)